MIKAVLFDLDNVLVDMSDVHYEALNASLKYHGFQPIDYQEHIKNYNGLPTKVKLQRLGDLNKIRRGTEHSIWKKKQEFTFDAIDKTLKWDHEKVDMLAALIGGGIDVACVTNSIRSTAKEMLKKTGMYYLMSFLISNEDVKNPKPSPEPYISAMKRLYLSPKESLIVEDSDTGIKSAKSSGGYVMPVKDWRYVTYDRIYRQIRKINND